MQLATRNGVFSKPKFKDFRDIVLPVDGTEYLEIFKRGSDLDSQTPFFENTRYFLTRKDIEVAEENLKIWLGHDFFKTGSLSDKENTKEVIDELINLLVTEDLIILLPTMVDGYALRNKKWGK